VVILQKFWVLNEQNQTIDRIVRLGQQWTQTTWVVHWAHSIDDRAQELYESRAIYAAQIMHGLITEPFFSYQELLNTHDTRIRDMKAEEKAPNTSHMRSPTRTPPYKSPTPGPVLQEQTPMNVGWFSDFLIFFWFFFVSLKFYFLWYCMHEIGIVILALEMIFCLCT
jgi:hypothetical protein